MLALVVEDDVAISTLYERILEQAGYDVLRAKNGEEAFQHLQAQIPALILLDMRLPGVNGVQILDYLGADARFERSHVVIATSSQEFERYTSVVTSAEFLLKPIRPQQIMAIANRINNR